jgi:hypothetical protein
MRRNQMLPLVLLFFAVAVSAQRPSPADERASLVQRIDARREHYATVAKEIWGFAEGREPGLNSIGSAARTSSTRRGSPTASRRWTTENNIW